MRNDNEQLKKLLEFKINNYLIITTTSPDYGFPEKIFNALIINKNTKHLACSYINEIYKALKSC